MPREIAPAELADEDRFAIVVAQWNVSVTKKLLAGAVDTLLAQGISDQAVDIAWVPGSWEIPLIAKRLAESGRYAAVLCLGAVIRGETSHDQHINRGVSMALSQISLQTNVPVLLGVLTCETLEQAIQRSGGSVGNKGSQCADAALTMVRLMKNIPRSGPARAMPSRGRSHTTT